MSDAAIQRAEAVTCTGCGVRLGDAQCGACAGRATVERIVHWLRVKNAERVDRAKASGWHPNDAGYVDALHDAAEAIEAGAWRGEEGK